MHEPQVKLFSSFAEAVGKYLTTKKAPGVKAQSA
jgi:hypothetical protein